MARIKRVGKGIVDKSGVTRWGSIHDVPDAYLFCLAWNHAWDVGAVVERPGWGGNVWEAVGSCSCGRKRRDVIDPLTGALHSRPYTGGHGFLAKTRPDKKVARLEFFRRKRARQEELERKQKKEGDSVPNQAG